MKKKRFVEQYLLGLTPGQWNQIKDLPPVIGLAGFIDAARDQILMPKFEIVIGRYFSTFKIVRMKSEVIKPHTEIRKSNAM